MLVMRRRGVWEAADSGVLLWRKNFLYIIPFFAIPVWIAAFGLRFIPEDFSYLSWIGLWWLKPLFDRLVLHLISARFFENPGLAKTPLLRGLGGDLVRGLWGDLLWRRFSFTRSGRMPIRVLERLKGKRFRQRKKALAAGGLNFGSFVTFLCFFSEWFLLGGEILFTYIMFDMFLPDLFLNLGDFMARGEGFIFTACCVNYMLVESLYVAMGFGVYINSRVETEGWDLQILFKEFESAKAGEDSSSPGTPGVFQNNKILLGLAFCLFLFFQAPLNAEGFSPAGAEETAETPAEFFPESFLPVEAVPRETLDEVLASPDFGYTKPGWGIRIKNSKKPDKVEIPADVPAWFEKIKEALGFGLRIFVCLAIGGFAVFVLYRLYRNRRINARGNFHSRKRKGGADYRNPLFSPESPEALFDKASEFFVSGSLREAWAACLRGSIAAYSQYGDIAFPSGATEYGCLALVRSSCAGAAGGFDELVTNWIYLAYAGRNPPEGAFERSLEFGRALETALGSRPSGENGGEREKGDA
jgi:hypothetical protein